MSEFARSGLKKSEFCRSRGLTWGTLNRHLERQRTTQRATSPASRLVAVELTDKKAGSECESSCRLAVVLSGGQRIEVPRGFDDHTFQRLVDLLERL